VEIGGYAIEGVVGEGAAAVVYRASDGAREVAVKLLRERDPELERRFEREARIAGEIDSRHVAPVLAAGPGWLVLPLYRTSLAALLRSDGPLTMERATEIAVDTAAGLDALHRRGILHRDVKPSNVLLDDAGRAAVSDFGLARAADSTRLTRDGQIVGTAHYLAPELIEGAPATVASDVYAFGCLLYEALTGTPPFAGRAEVEIGFAHLVEEPDDPRTRRPELPADAALAVLTALAKEPSARPTTPTALARMLHVARTGSPA
jgi:serine/threonine-protein kinase